jgi:hypothetical protein
MQIGHFEKFLEMILGRPSLPLEITLGSRYALLTRVAGFFISAATIGCYDDATGLRLLALLAALNTFSGTLDGGLGGCGPATIGHRSHFA